jgi:hypothetical protein
MGRKLLEVAAKKAAIHSQNNDQKSSTRKIAGLATAGGLVVCCIFLCTCFQRKRKATTAHTVLAKDPHSSEYNFLI